MTKQDQLSGEDALRALARALAPYLLDEIRGLLAEADRGLDLRYDETTCTVFVEVLGDQVLERALALFSLLAREGIVDSVTLADAISVAPRAISGHLTTPLKRRAKALKLPLPFFGGEGSRPDSGLLDPPPEIDTSRTHWQDHDGIALRMLSAIGRELACRRRREAESQVFDGRPLHTHNAALTPTGTEAAAAATDDEIWVFANSFQGYAVFGYDWLYQLALDAIPRWEEHHEVPSSLTLLRAVLFALARIERTTDYDGTAWAEHKWFMRTLARRIAAHVKAGEVEDEYEMAVVWIGSTASERAELWERVTAQEARAQPPTRPGATFVFVPSTLPESQELALMMRDVRQRGDADG